MNLKSIDLYGQALFDFFNGDISAKVVIHTDDGLTTELPISTFFRDSKDFSLIEHVAIARCRGDVLDVGAGTGCHSLVLQERDLSVFAINICGQAVEIMHKRGVNRVQCANIFEFSGGPFDTILMMMHGIGMVDTPDLEAIWGTNALKRESTSPI